MVGHRHGVLQETPDLAPRRIGDDPIDGLIPIEEIAIFFDFAPMRVGKVSEEVSITSARLEHDALGLKMADQSAG